MSARVVIETPGPIYSGCQVQGKLICTFTNVQKIRNIKVRAYGKEHTEWWRNERSYDSINKRQQTRRVKYYGDNSLFSLETLLFGHRNGEVEIGPGTFTYDFTFTLPDNLPGSFQNPHGSIRYCIKGTVDIPWEPDFEDEACFFIATPIDLNRFPSEYFQAATVSDEKTICCWCCTGGLITVTASINKIAFVLGENIKINVVITNMSNTNVNGLQARLAQYIKCHVKSPKFETKTEGCVLADRSWSGVSAHGERRYDVDLEIPNGVLVPNFERCSLFEVTHDLEIFASIRGCHLDVKLSIGVNLGHIHNRNHSNPTIEGWDSTGVTTSAPITLDEPPNYATVSQKSRASGTAENLQGAGHSTSTFFEEPPPSYEDVIRMK